MLANGVAPGNLYLVERDRHFVKILERRFPRCHVIAADALALEQDLDVAAGFDFVISGLPLLCFSPDKRYRALRQALQLLKPHGRLHQFTYGGRCPVDRDLRALLRVNSVLLGIAALNLPPGLRLSHHAAASRREPAALRPSRSRILGKTARARTYDVACTTLARVAALVEYDGLGRRQTNTMGLRRQEYACRAGAAWLALVVLAALHDYRSAVAGLLAVRARCCPPPAVARRGVAGADAAGDRRRRSARASAFRRPTAVAAVGCGLRRNPIDFEYYDVDGDARTPVIVLLPVFNEQLAIPRFFARYFANQGWAAVVAMRGRDPLETLVAPTATVQGNLQDYSRVLDWIEREPELDASRIGVFGVSLGAMDARDADRSRTARELARHRDGGRRLVVSAGQHELSARRAHDRRDGSESRHEPRGARRKLDAEIELDPLALAPYVDAERVLMIITRTDAIIPFEAQQQLRTPHGLSRDTVLGHRAQDIGVVFPEGAQYAAFEFFAAFAISMSREQRSTLAGSAARLRWRRSFPPWRFKCCHQDRRKPKTSPPCCAGAARSTCSPRTPSASTVCAPPSK